jgi:hypothetical protein
MTGRATRDVTEAAAAVRTWQRAAGHAERGPRAGGRTTVRVRAPHRTAGRGGGAQERKAWYAGNA